jgi:DNA-binding NtrC family response regulator
MKDKLRKTSSSVLFVSPHTDDADRLSQMLSPLPLVFDHVPDLQQARDTFHRHGYRVILTEAGLPDGSWHDVLALSREAWPAADVIVTDLHADARFWAEALNLGAYDLLVKPFCESEVRRILTHACSRFEGSHTARSAM